MCATVKKTKQKKKFHDPCMIQ